MKIRSAYKVVFGTVALCGALWFGYRAWSSYQVSLIRFDPIAPGRVNLVAVDPGLGYRIIVSNNVAKLAEVKGGGFPDRDYDSQSDVDESASQKRVPITAMLKSLQGDEKALSQFVMSLNNISESSLPPVQKRWRAESIRKALAGDQKLVTKLEDDLNMRLNGMPIPSFSMGKNGIVIDSPVSINVQVGSEKRTLIARVLEHYQPRFLKDVERMYTTETTPRQAAAFYEGLAKELLNNPAQAENIRGAIEARISDGRLKGLARSPEKLLANTTVVMNETHVEGASYQKFSVNDGKEYCKLKLTLSEQGRRRLWKYSHGRGGFQLLLIVNGTAIGAPRISHELSAKEITISQLPDESLVKEAIEELIRANNERK